MIDYYGRVKNSEFSSLNYNPVKAQSDKCVRDAETALVGTIVLSS